MRITERGWAGHFCGSQNCMFRRNTLIEHKDQKIVVSTVGGYCPNDQIEAVGYKRYYETMAFVAKKAGYYLEADVRQELSFENRGSICAESPDDLPDDVDNVANEMHDDVVAEICLKLSHGSAVIGLGR